MLYTPTVLCTVACVSVKSLKFNYISFLTSMSAVVASVELGLSRINYSLQVRGQVLHADLKDLPWLEK